MYVRGVFVMVVFLLKVLCGCVLILARFSRSVLGTCCSFTTKICINELRKSSKVIGLKCPLVGKQHVLPRSRV